MIYDAFLFFNELDLLDIRFNLLNYVVDKFVIVESTVTFSGKPKRLFFNENKYNFSKFSDKIIHVIIDDTPDDFYNLSFISNPQSKNDEFKNKILGYLNSSSGWHRHEKQWGREIYQRESILNGLIDCSDNDMIIISDVDEIPNPNEFEFIKNNVNEVFELKQNMFYYFINILKEVGWSGPKIAPWKIVKNNSLNIIRQNKLTTSVINNGGWHLSFMGGESRIKDKIEAYAHQEFNNDHIKNNINRNISSNSDLFFRGSRFEEIDIYSEYPKKMIDIIRVKYPYMIK